MAGVFFDTCRESVTLKTSNKGHAYVQIPLLVANGRDLLGYPAQEIVRLVGFADLARQLSKTIRKGDTVRAEGAIKLERWNDREGFQRCCLALIASKAEKLNAEPAPAFNNGKKNETEPQESRRADADCGRAMKARDSG